MADEIIDIVDETGRVLRQAAKGDAHKHGWMHVTVIGHMLAPNGDWILVRQAPDRQDAGQLVGLVGGHVRAGESEVDALIREIEEETGIRNVTHNFVGRRRFHRQVIGRDENHLFAVYEFSSPDDIVLGDEGVSTETFSPTQLRQAIADNPAQFGDAFYFVEEVFYPHHLPENWVYRFHTV